MKLKVLTEGDERLRVICKPVTKITPAVKRLIADMTSVKSVLAENPRGFFAAEEPRRFQAAFCRKEWSCRRFSSALHEMTDDSVKFGGTRG